MSPVTGASVFPASANSRKGTSNASRQGGWPAGGSGDDTLAGGIGNGDAIHIENFVAENPLATQSFASFRFADGSSLSRSDLLARGSDLDGTDLDDEIIGTGVADRIDGRAGNDLIWSLAGDDTITGGTGTDGLNGGLGDDSYLFNAGDSSALAGPAGVQTETLVDDGGFDTVCFASAVVPPSLLVRDNLDGSLLIDYHTAGQAIDRLLIVGGLDGRIESWKVGAGETARTRDHAQFVGEFGSGVLRGTDAQGRPIVAGGKSDELIVVAGNQALVCARHGSDSLRLRGNNATLTVYRGDGIDHLEAQGTNATLRFADQTADELAFSRSVYTLPAFQGDDYLDGGAGNDTLSGDGGADELYGGAGNDWLSAFWGNDVPSNEALWRLRA